MYRSTDKQIPLNLLYSMLKLLFENFYLKNVIIVIIACFFYVTAAQKNRSAFFIPCYTPYFTF